VRDKTLEKLRRLEISGSTPQDIEFNCWVERCDVSNENCTSQTSSSKVGFELGGSDCNALFIKTP